MVGKVMPLKEKGMGVHDRGQIKLPPRAESIVRVPVTPGSPNIGVTRKGELQEGIFMAAALTKVVEGYIMTSILNVNDEEKQIQEPTVELDDVNLEGDRNPIPKFEPRDRETEI
jgi:hypothetical protein